MFKIFGNWKTLDLEVLKIQRCEVNKLWSNFASIIRKRGLKSYPRAKF